VDSIAAVELSTPTLKLRYPTVADAPALLELGSDPEVTRFFSWGPYTSVSEPHAYIARLPGEREDGRQLDMLIVHHEHGPIGVTGLSEFSHRDRRAIVGTWLGRDYWGTGANAESKALLGALAFGPLGLERLGAYADVENGRSQAALERVGFVREGVLRRWHRHGDTVHDVVMFSLLREEFSASPLGTVKAQVSGEPPPAFVV
jgi:ribosomal-protein-alanine N-acetyltransferase